MKVTEGCAMFSVSTRKWYEIPSMNSARSRHSSCLLVNTIFVVGGLNALLEAQNSIERLDLAQKDGAWQELSLTS